MPVNTTLTFLLLQSLCKVPCTAVRPVDCCKCKGKHPADKQCYEQVLGLPGRPAAQLAASAGNSLHASCKQANCCQGDMASGMILLQTKLKQKIQVVSPEPVAPVMTPARCCRIPHTPVLSGQGV